MIGFLREKLPYKNYTPKSGTINGAIIGILLMWGLSNTGRKKTTRGSVGKVGSTKKDRWFARDAVAATRRIEHTTCRS